MWGDDVCLVTCPAKYVFCSKIPQLAGPREDLIVKFVFRGMGRLSYKCWSAGKWGHVGGVPEKSSRAGAMPGYALRDYVSIKNY